MASDLLQITLSALNFFCNIKGGQSLQNYETKLLQKKMGWLPLLMAFHKNNVYPFIVMVRRHATGSMSFLLQGL